MKNFLITTLLFFLVVTGTFAGTSMIYHHDGNGTAIEGSKQALIDAVKEVCSIRFMIITGTNQFSMADAEWVMLKNNEIYASNSAHVSVTFSGGTLKYQDNPYHWFVIAGTNGLVDMSRWTINLFENRGHTSSRFSIKWFIKY